MAVVVIVVAVVAVIVVFAIVVAVVVVVAAVGAPAASESASSSSSSLSSFVSVLFNALQGEGSEKRRSTPFAAMAGSTMKRLEFRKVRSLVGRARTQSILLHGCAGGFQKLKMLTAEINDTFVTQKPGWKTKRRHIYN